jgi:hypothetical protein
MWYFQWALMVDEFEQPAVSIMIHLAPYISGNVGRLKGVSDMYRKVILWGRG